MIFFMLSMSSNHKNWNLLIQSRIGIFIIFYLGYAKDGGLYLPESIPKISPEERNAWWLLNDHCLNGFQKKLDHFTNQNSL